MLIIDAIVFTLQCIFFLYFAFMICGIAIMVAAIPCYLLEKLLKTPFATDVLLPFKLILHQIRKSGTDRSF